MYDSDNPLSIPEGVFAAGYVNGYAGPVWNAYGWLRFPNAKRITVFPTDEGDVCDVEWLDLTPEQAPPWVKGRLAAGILSPWVYVNRSNRGAVERALTMAGVLSDQVALWVATLDGTQTVPAGPYPIAAVQYANSVASGGHYDLSLVNQTFAPGGGTIGGDDMTPGQEAALFRVAEALGVSDANAAIYQYQYELNAIKAELDALTVKVSAISGGGSTPTPEPKTVTLHVPAQDIKGDIA